MRPRTLTLSPAQMRELHTILTSFASILYPLVHHNRSLTLTPASRPWAKEYLDLVQFYRHEIERGR